MADWIDGDVLGAPESLADRALDQWESLVAVYTTATATGFVNDAARADPCAYWLRVRALYPELAHVMLFWLACPPGSCGIERDFPP